MPVSLNDIVSSLISQQSRSQVFLQRTRKLNPLREEDRKLIELMNNPSFNDRVTAFLTNLITSGDRLVFCVSVRSLDEAIKNDPNWDRTASMNKDNRRKAFAILRLIADEIVPYDTDSQTPGVFRLKDNLIRTYMSEKLGVNLHDLEIEQEAQCREWVNQKKESRADRVLEEKRNGPPQGGQGRLLMLSDERGALKSIVRRLIEETVNSQPVAGWAYCMVRAIREELRVSSKDIPFDVFIGHEDSDVRDAKQAMKDACKLNLNQWLETVDDSTLESHHRLCEIVRAYARMKSGSLSGHQNQFSFDFEEARSFHKRLIERLGLRYLSPDQHGRRVAAL